MSETAEQELTASQKKRAQRKRQQERIRKGVAERTSERNRARTDRVTLADWIDQHVDGVAVDRRKSGCWTVVAGEAGE